MFTPCFFRSAIFFQETKSTMPDFKANVSSAAKMDVFTYCLFMFLAGDLLPIKSIF